MSDEDERAAREAAEDFSVRMAAFWRDQLGARLIGVYRIGSLAHGGFSRRYSDIDMAVIAEDGLSATELEQSKAGAVAITPAQGSKLSIFWTDRGFSIGRFPPLDRVDYVDHAVPVVERERVRPARPDLDAIRAYLRGQPIDAWREQLRRCAAMATLGPGDHKPYLRAMLYPARFVFSWMTGRMASNDEAVAFLHDHSCEGLNLDLIDRALRLRQDAGDLDPLLLERDKLAAQFSACLRLTGIAS